uniref:Uncharacterized protein n=1 Tax=Vitis vinifera TaxID=29760 RepID=A5C6S5_VITVI|nr:hypothetical protein VITISV_042520 [Vitis vinifera]
MGVKKGEAQASAEHLNIKADTEPRRLGTSYTQYSWLKTSNPSRRILLNPIHQTLQADNAQVCNMITTQAAKYTPTAITFRPGTGESSSIAAIANYLKFKFQEDLRAEKTFGSHCKLIHICH